MQLTVRVEHSMQCSILGEPENTTKGSSFSDSLAETGSVIYSFLAQYHRRAWTVQLFTDLVFSFRLLANNLLGKYTLYRFSSKLQNKNKSVLSMLAQQCSFTP